MPSLVPFPFAQGSTSGRALAGTRVAARIDVSEDGGPVRTIVNGRHRKPVGRYASRKAGRSLPWEAREERAFFWLCEADAQVVDYLSQPHRLGIFRDEGEELVYYPDVRRDMADGSIEIVEVKKSLDDRRLADPSYVLKLELARQVYAGLGWGFRVVTQAEMRRGLRLRNAMAVQRNRFASFDARDSLTLLTAIQGAGGRIAMDAAADLLGSGPCAEAKLRALIVGRVVAVDLDARLDGRSYVFAVNGTYATAGQSSGWGDAR